MKRSRDTRRRKGWGCRLACSKKVAVQLDLDRHGELREDVHDQLLAEERAGDKREPYTAVRKRLVRAGKLRG